MFKLTDSSESEFDYTGKVQVAGIKRLKRSKKSEKIKKLRKKPDTSSSSTDGECATSPPVLAGSRNAPAASSSYFTAHYTGIYSLLVLILKLFFLFYSRRSSRSTGRAGPVQVLQQNAANPEPERRRRNSLGPN